MFALAVGIVLHGFHCIPALDRLLVVAWRLNGVHSVFTFDCVSIHTRAPQLSPFGSYLTIAGPSISTDLQ